MTGVQTCALPISVVIVLSVEVLLVFAEEEVDPVEIIIVGSLADGLVCVCVCVSGTVCP